MNTHPSLLRPLLYRWFVQYNPFFTASALCVLGGVLVLSRALGVGSERLLTVVLEMYQWLLVGGAGVLYRRLHERRPATILGLLAVVFAMDPTLQVSALSSAGSVVGATLWIVSFAAKLRALVWAFRLRVTDAVCTLPVVGAVFVVAIMLARWAAAESWLPSFVAWAAFAWSFAAVRVTWTVESLAGLNDDAEKIFPRVLKAVVGIAVAGALYQVVNVCLAFHPMTVFVAVGSVVLALATNRTDAADVVRYVVGGTFLFLLGGDLQAALLPVSVVLLVTSHRFALVALLTVVFAHRAVVVGVPAWDEPVARFALDLVSTGVLVVAVLHHRARWVLLGLPVLNHAWLGAMAKTCVTIVATGFAAMSAQGLGGLLVGAGFVLLPAGVALHRWLSRSLDGWTQLQEQALARVAVDAGLLDDDRSALASMPGPSSSAPAFSSTAVSTVAATMAPTAITPGTRL
jgi:hypothetical protein